MNHVCLDHNVITLIVKDPTHSLLPVLEKAKLKVYRFPYSPAHIEEIAVIYREVSDFAKADGYVTEHLKCLSSVTDELGYLPAEVAGSPRQRRCQI